MFASRLARMNTQIERVMFDGTCVIEKPVNGEWESLGEFPCNVQSGIVSPSVEDAAVARTDEQKQVTLYLKPDAPVATGYRVHWGSRIWNMGADTKERTSQGMVSVILTDWQIAVTPEALTFWRMRNGAREVIGTFDVSVTINEYTYGITTGRNEGDDGTASGTTDTGTLVGGSDLEAVQVGDWFTRNNAPGRITAKYKSDSERYRLAFSIDRAAR